MKKLVFVLLVAFVFCPMAMASDMAFYTGFPNDGWYSDAQKNIDVAYIIAQTGGLFTDVQTFDDTQDVAATAWITANINDGEMDIIWLPGTMPSLLYPLGNTSPDGSPAELWLDGGNMFINVADWFAYCSYEGGTRQTPDNGAGGAENILDLPGIITSADQTTLTRSAAGATYMPGLPATYISDRQVTLGAVTGDWEVSEMFGDNETVADPIVIHNTATDAYMVFINQADIADTLDRGLLTSQFLNNWAASLLGDNPYPRSPNPADEAVDVPVDANVGWTRGDGTVQDEVYFGTDPCALPKVADIMVLPPFPPLYDPPADLVASTTYYWQIVEVNGVNRYEGPIWEFTTVRGEAQPEYPYDGAIIGGDTVTYLGDVYIWTKLIFVPGPTAASHTGYFNEDYSKVDSRAQDANLGGPPYISVPGWEYTYFAGNPQVPPANYTLERGKRYYWTVDEKDALGNTFDGDVWEFAIQGFKAFAPSPPNEAVMIPTDVLLRWLPGFGVEDHDIYMSTSWEDVNNAEYNAVTPPPEYLYTRSDPNYQVSGLSEDTKLYWRVDQVVGRMPPPIGGGTYNKGDVWCFTTGRTGSGLRGDYYHHTGAAAPAGFETFVVTRLDPVVDFGWGTGAPAPGVNVDDFTVRWRGEVGIPYSGLYTFYAASDDGARLWVDDMTTPIIDAWVDRGETESASEPIYLAAGYYDIKMEMYENGGDAAARLRWSSSQVSKSIIPTEYLIPFVQVKAHDPDPRDGQASVPTSYNLRWGPGETAAQHDVYLGTDKAAVTNATTSSTGIYQGRYGPNTLPVSLTAAEFYYWRVDEVNLAGPDPCLWKGDTWTFRTVGAAGGVLGLYYHWDGQLPPAQTGYEPGPPNPFQIFVMSRIDPEINFNWDAGSPDPSINVEDFSSRWVGHLECPVDANYTFYTSTDDGARLFIDDQELQLIELANPTHPSWQQQGMGAADQWRASVVLSAGLHDIEMHQYERAGGAGAELRWSSIPTNPSDEAIEMQIISAMWLWPPLFASGPRPPDGATIDDRAPALEWIAGVNAAYHELYFSANFDDVNNRNPLVKEVMTDPCRPYPPAAPLLKLATTYYWLVDEVKSPTERWNARTVWEFTISECLSLDNMEDYNDRSELRLVWRDGYADVVWGGVDPYYYLAQGGSSGSKLNVSTAVGSPFGAATGPIPPAPLNFEAMVLQYDNDGFTYVYPTSEDNEEKWVYDAPYYSEIEANTLGTNSLGVGQTWDSEGVKSLSLSFQGHPISDGYYDAALWPAYTIFGRGRDIQGRHDEFYLFSKYPFIGNGSVQAQVLSMDNTDPWAKAGVMIREKWAPYSMYVAVFVTPGNGVTFQWRDVEDGPTNYVTKTGVSAPEYVRLVRNIDGTFEAKHSDNGLVWEDVNAPGSAPVFPPVPMGSISDPNLYAGSAVTSHNANQICAADFNNLLISPLPGNYIFGNIGTNDPEQLYVALSDGTNTDVVEHDDVNAATLTTWQEWNIALSEFTTVNLDAVKKVYIGFGDRAAPVQGGSGAIYVDDIRACPPRCIPTLAKPLYDLAQPYDCIVSEPDLALVGIDWLMRDELITTVAPNPANLLASYQFEGNYLDSSGQLNHLTDPCGTAPGFDTGVVGSFALTLDGVSDHLVTNVNDIGIDGNVPRTICCWAKADHTNITDWTLIFGFTNLNGVTNGHFNIGSLGGPGGVGAHVWGWEETIFTDEESLDWHHYAMSYDGTTIRYYGDGVEMDTDVAKSNVRNLVTEDRVHVGKRATSDLYFPGDVDDARVYGVQLSKEEIAYIATGGAATLHVPIQSIADVYQAEPQGNQWINFKDYSLMADKYLEEVLWPLP